MLASAGETAKLRTLLGKFQTIANQHANSNLLVWYICHEIASFIADMSAVQARFNVADSAFRKLLGPDASIRMCLEDKSKPWAHEACVYIPSTSDVFVTSNRLVESDGTSKVIITKINIKDEPFTREEVMTDIPMANGGVNFLAGVLFCAQGTLSFPSGLIYMEARPPYKTMPIVESFNGRPFNSLNDVVVHNDGSIWFTDPVYGFEQGFRPPPKLPNQVYRFDPARKSIRAMADGFGRPNGISFSPDQSVVYVTDTDIVHGDGTIDRTRASTMQVAGYRANYAEC